MESENPLYKTAELVRDAVGCYYFICLQCGKDFENLDDTVMHIEKYFYEASEDENDALTPMTINEPDWMSNESDVETVANIKKESFEEYEDYKLSVPDHQSGDEQADSHPDFCPLCSSQTETSLESHLMVVHNRTKANAKIYECEICGRNTFTRSYDLERHKLTHARYIKPSSEASSSPLIARSELESQRRNGDRNKHSVLLNILSQSTKKPTTELLPVNHAKNVSPNPPNAKVCANNKRYHSTEDLNKKLQTKKVKPAVEIDRSITTVQPSGFCSICRTPLKKETLEAHLIRVHHRNKSYAQVYECNVCGKNSFTRPYDLRRHQLIHLTKVRTGRKPILPKKTNDKTVIAKVPLTKRLIKAETSQDRETSSATEVENIATEIRTTNPQRDGILCAICGMKFESYLDVTMHLKVAHNQKRIYKCSQPDCESESFTSAFLLHRHEISHSMRYRSIVGNNQNRMKCVFCRRSFNKKWNLMKHEKRHLLEMAEQSDH